MYPKDVIQYVNARADIKDLYGIKMLSRNETFGEQEQDFSFDIEKWMFTQGVLESKEIKKYIIFLKNMKKIFLNIRENFEVKNPGRAGEKDELQLYTCPEQMFFIANSLYIMDSFGVEGDVLECGAFKGFSSSCLSWVCNYLNRKLIVADSFQGLPPPRYEFETGYYKESDFKGTFTEVTSNVNIFGRSSNVEYIKGFYCDSLKGFNRKLALLWLDVDLYSSAMDVLENTFNYLDKKGVIFSDEIPDNGVNDEGLFNMTGDYVPKAYNDFFAKSKIDYRAVRLFSSVGLVLPRTKTNPKFMMNQNTKLYSLCN